MNVFHDNQIALMDGCDKFLLYERIPTNKCNRNDRFGKSSFCKS